MFRGEHSLARKPSVEQKECAARASNHCPDSVPVQDPPAPITPDHVKLYVCQGSAVEGCGCTCAIPKKSVEALCPQPVLGSVDGMLPLDSSVHVKSFLKGLMVKSSVKIPLLELGHEIGEDAAEKGLICRFHQFWSSLPDLRC